MKIILTCAIIFVAANFSSVIGAPQNSATNAVIPGATNAKSKSDLDQEKKAAEWAASLQLNDAAKTERVTEAIATHLKAVRDWHNSHSYTNVPAGMNPTTGKALSVLGRQLIADSAMPKSVHENLMTALQNDLNDEQVDAILDKYTVGKVAFTLRGYEAIVPDLTGEEKTHLTTFLIQARKEAIDFKDMKEISGVFEIYKTQCEQYLNSNGRNWRELYKAYVKKIQAQKAAAASGKINAP